MVNDLAQATNGTLADRFGGPAEHGATNRPSEFYVHWGSTQKSSSFRPSLRPIQVG
jgi:hypothetical protein